MISKKQLELYDLTCVNFNIRKTARVTTSFYDSCLKSIGIKITQFTLLATISNEGEKSISELAKITSIDRTTLHRSLDILEKDGWVLIKDSPNANSKKVSLSKSGDKKLTEAFNLWSKGQKKIMSNLGREKFKQLLDLLTLVREASSEI